MVAEVGNSPQTRSLPKIMTLQFGHHWQSNSDIKSLMTRDQSHQLDVIRGVFFFWRCEVVHTSISLALGCNDHTASARRGGPDIWENPSEPSEKRFGA